MTVSTTNSKTIALGDGVAAAFAFNFIGVAAAYVSVIFTDAAGVETALASSSYSITLNAAPEGALWGIGGSVTYPLVGSPIAAGTRLTIYRNLPLLQAISLQNQASYGQISQSIEQSIDLLEMQMQQVSEVSSRAILANITNTVAPAELPPAAQAASKGVIFSADGNSLVAGEIPASGVISSAMAPVVSAASLAAGRTAFGLRAMATEGIGGGLADDGANNARVIFAVQQVATNQAIGASAYLNKFEATGVLTFTLARANTLWSGFGFWVDALTGPIALAINANDNFQGIASGVTLYIPKGLCVFVKTNALASGTWWVEGTPSLGTDIRTTGGNGNGSVNNDAALVAAFAAIGSNNGAILIPAGTWNFNAKVTLTLAANQSLSLLGVGAAVSILNWPNATGGLQINYNGPGCSFHCHDVTFQTGNAGGNTGLLLNQAGTLLGSFQISTLYRLTFQGSDNGGANAKYWDEGYTVQGVSGVSSESICAYGSGASLGNGCGYVGINTGAQYAVQLNIAKSYFFRTAIGLRMGSFVQGLTIDQTNFTNGVIGIAVPAGALGTLAQLSITDGQFNTTGDQIQINTQVVNLYIEDCLIFVPATKAGITGLATVYTIQGNQIVNGAGPVGTGISLTGSFGVIDGNIFNGMLTGVRLLNTAGGNFQVVTGNIFQSVSTVGTTGLRVDGTGVMVVGNVFNNHATGVNLSGTSASCNQQSNIYLNNTTAHVDTGTGNVVGGGSA